VSTPVRHELVPANFAGAEPPARREENALLGLLARSVVHEQAGAPIPSDLLRFGFAGAGALLLTALIAALMPSPAVVRQAHFFLLFGGVAATLTRVLQALGPFTLALGCGLLVLDLCLESGRRHAAWRYAIVGQAALGAAGLGLDGVLLAIVLLDMALWIMIVVAFAVAIFCCIAGALSEL
jgi:hypothetical protein